MTRLTHGALVINDFPLGVSRTLRFQFNPETITRSIEPRTVGGQAGDKSAYATYAGAPKESFSLELFMDATDRALPNSRDKRGLLPQLDAFEAILYPQSPKVVANAALSLAGVIEILPYHAPTVLLILGKHRQMPVRITKYDAVEESHNEDYAPTRAKVTVSVEVVSYSDVSAIHPDYARFLRYQITKELRALDSYERLGVSVWGVGGLE